MVKDDDAGQTMCVHVSAARLPIHLSDENGTILKQPNVFNTSIFSRLKGLRVSVMASS